MRAYFEGDDGISEAAGNRSGLLQNWNKQLHKHSDKLMKNYGEKKITARKSIWRQAKNGSHVLCRNGGVYQ